MPWNRGNVGTGTVLSRIAISRPDLGCWAVMGAHGGQGAGGGGDAVLVRVVLLTVLHQLKGQPVPAPGSKLVLEDSFSCCHLNLKFDFDADPTQYIPTVLISVLRLRICF